MHPEESRAHRGRAEPVDRGGKGTGRASTTRPRVEVSTESSAEPRHWNGTAWEVPPSPEITGLVFDVWVNARDDAWAAGEGGMLMHWDGASWTTVPLETTVSLLGLWGTARDDVWVVGDKRTVLHFDGAAWTPVFAAR